jgi:hypothetical protein
LEVIARRENATPRAHADETDAAIMSNAPQVDARGVARASARAA